MALERVADVDTVLTLFLLCAVTPKNPIFAALVPRFSVPPCTVSPVK
jgi:hypothetical protein